MRWRGGRDGGEGGDTDVFPYLTENHHRLKFGTKAEQVTILMLSQILWQPFDQDLGPPNFEECDPVFERRLGNKLLSHQ